MIDSHCHPQFPMYDEDRDEVIKRTLDGGVDMICVGTDLDMSKKAIELAEKYPRIWASLGLHPTDINGPVDMNDYEKLLGEEKVIAVGEIGLDYYRVEDEEKQKKTKDGIDEIY